MITYMRCSEINKKLMLNCRCLSITIISCMKANRRRQTEEMVRGPVQGFIIIIYLAQLKHQTPTEGK